MKKFFLKEKAGPEKRRFPRVQIQRPLAELIGVLDAQLVWPNHETSDILDLSYKGLSARRPGIFPFAAQHVVNVEVKLGGMPSFRAEARIAWCAAEWAGMEFLKLTSEAQLILNEFLQAKMMAGQLRVVDRSLIAREETFQVWFQGPQDTHVFVWQKDDQGISRVSVDFGGNTVELERGRSFDPSAPRMRQALRLLSQMDKPGLPMEEFVRRLVSGI